MSATSADMTIRSNHTASRLPGTKGRPRVSGARQPTLRQRLADPKGTNTKWRHVTVTGWYGQGDRQLLVASGTALWCHPGKQVPIRWVLVREAAGAFEPQAFVCTDQAANPVDVLRMLGLTQHRCYQPQSKRDA